MKTVRDFDFKDKRVIIRTDFNVSIDEKGMITEDSKIRETIPTLNYILKTCKQLIIITHLGRPDGKVDETLRLNNVATRLEKLLHKPVAKLEDCIDISIPDKKIILLENLRFHKEEEENNEEFAKKLASYADIYVNDAFGTMHRAHASTAGITKFLPGCIGLLVEKELKYLDLKDPEKPFVAILGGAKISTKFELVQMLLQKVDYLLLGGAMVFTFYKAKGYEVGYSIYEKENDILLKAKFLMNNEKLILPTDIVIASSRSDKADIKTVSADQIPSNYFGLDIGHESVEEFKNILKNAKTVIWNGPLGYFEMKPFDKATNEIAKYLSHLKATTILGGGDTEAAINKIGLKGKFTHVSTGGGASLEYLSGKELPAIKALKENEINFSKV